MSKNTKHQRPQYSVLRLDDAKIAQLSSDVDASILALIAYYAHIGLQFWQQTSGSQRIMFDATQFNKLHGLTATKGIKGDFLKRLTKMVDESDGSENEKDQEEEEGKEKDHQIASSAILASPAACTARQTATRSHADRDSDCFEAIIASGYRGDELFDPRVGSTRLIHSTPDVPRLLAKKESCLYLIHVLVLGAWIMSKAHGISTKLSRLFSLPATPFVISEQLPPLEKQQKSIAMHEQSRMENSLQFKHPDTLQHVLAVAALMEQAEERSIGAAVAIFQEDVENEQDEIMAEDTSKIWLLSTYSPQETAPGMCPLPFSRYVIVNQHLGGIPQKKPARRIVPTRVE